MGYRFWGGSLLLVSLLFFFTGCGNSFDTDTPQNTGTSVSNESSGDGDLQPEEDQNDGDEQDDDNIALTAAELEALTVVSPPNAVTFQDVPVDEDLTIEGIEPTLPPLEGAATILPTELENFGGQPVPPDSINVTFPDDFRDVFPRIVGDDNGVLVRGDRVLETPFSSVCRLYVTTTGRLRNGSNEVRVTNVGTGFIVGPRHILTAAHCVYDENFDPADAIASSVTVVPGLRNQFMPFGSYNSRAIFVKSAYRNGDRRRSNDLALIVVDSDIASRAGSFTLRVPQSLSGGVVANILGYRGTGREMSYVDGPIRSFEENGLVALRYTMDTTGGVSGAPIYLINPSNGSGVEDGPYDTSLNGYFDDRNHEFASSSKQSRAVIGVHSAEVVGQQENAGGVISPANLNIINGWLRSSALFGRQ